MKSEILKAIADGARQIAGETSDRADALQYVEELMSDIDQEFRLGYEPGSDSWGVLHKACYSAIWEATDA